MSASPRSSSPATAHLNINLPESFKPFEILISPYVLEVIPKAVHERKLFFARFFGWIKDHPLLLTCGTLATSFYLQAILSSFFASFSTPFSKLNSSVREFLDLSPSEKVDACADKVSVCGKAATEKQAVWMAAYGGLVGGPVKHFLPQIINYFQGLLPASARSSDRRKTVVKLLLSYGVQAPVEIGIWLASMSFISGSRSAGQIKSAVKSGFGPIFRATLIAQTIAVLLARRLGEQKTAKWAAILQFVTGCIGMTIVKKRAVPSSPGGGGGASAGREGKGKGKASSGGGGKGGGLGGASWSGGGSSSFGGGGSGYVVSGGGQQQEGVGYRGKFPTWQPGVDYKVGDHVYFRDKDYAVEQAHRSQGDWTPDKTPNLFGAMEGQPKGHQVEK